MTIDLAKQALLKQSPLFAALPKTALAQIADTLRPAEYPAGTILLHEGEAGDRFCIIAEGQVAIMKALGTPDERLLGVRQAGEFFGEMSLLDPDGRRTASAVALQPVQLWEMTRQDFDRLLRRRPTVAYAVLRIVSARLRTAHELTIADLRDHNRRLSEAYEELRAAQEQIVKSEKLAHELQLARTIQESILPRSFPKLPGFDFAARVIPARVVGGDLFDFIPLDHNRVAIVVGDVSGKGMPAAIFMALTRSLLRAEAGRAVSPAATLRRVNRLMQQMNTAHMFVTVLYGVLDAATHEFRYARAGHEVPIVFTAQGTLCVPEYGPGQPLGMLAEPELDERVLPVPPGSTLLAFTDGVTDVRDGEGALFGWDRFCAAAQANLAGSAQDTCEGIWQALAGYQGTAEQADDVTLVVVRATTTAADQR